MANARYGAEKFTIDDPRVEPCPTTGCWLWVGTINPNGYGHAGGGGKRKVRAHRAVWAKYRGPIPEGMFLDHMCRVRSCVNPDHLRVVTPRQNTLENSESITARLARRTACSNCGGPYTMRKNGRKCYPCDAKPRKKKSTLLAIEGSAND